MLVACTKDDVTTTASFEELKATQPTPVAFSTYLGESTTTRAAIDADADLRTAGFGVFAYYTNDKKYMNTSDEQTPQVVTDAQTPAIAPNFMYNQRVSYSSGWTYAPIKYWPNDFNGANQAVDARTSGTAATGSKANYLSFFAYAPYATPSGSETNGIKAFSANTAHTDPIVTYTMGASSSTDFVDLLGGVYNGTGNVKNVLNNNNDGGIVQYTDGITKDGKANVNINLQKQYTDGAVGFSFKHALAKLGNITVDAIVDQGTLDNTKTIITVSSVSITSSVNNEGTLNLATGVWTTTGSASPFALNFGSAVGNITINQHITDPSDFGNTYLEDTGTDGIEDSWKSGTPTVTTTAQDLARAAPFVVFIPDTKPSFNVSITYKVRTADQALSAKYTDVEQTISKSISFANAFEMNKIYNLAIHLGLTSVKFTATVENWDTANPVSQSVDLPINVASN